MLSKSARHQARGPGGGTQEDMGGGMTAAAAERLHWCISFTVGDCKGLRKGKRRSLLTIRPLKGDF